MTAFALLPGTERTAWIAEAAARLDVSPIIVEKDFWVCWILGRIFSSGPYRRHLVFKGGTSLSKVFGAIRRFSEDIDLSVAPQLLGWTESDLDDAPSRSKRDERFAQLESDCVAQVRGEIRTTLEQSVAERLGPRDGGAPWLEYETDQTSDSPVLVFAYPTALHPASGYIRSAVKLEFGSLTDQQPTGTHVVRPLVADAFRETFDDWQSDVVALEIERTFWEKATILHAEYHRPADQALRDRLARHYADFAMLWQHPTRQDAMARLDLLHRVATFKGRFFRSSWSNYATARPSTLRVSPPAHRIPALERDYAKMEAMFIGKPSPFADLLKVLHEAEDTINAAQ
jgi:hypothetical protein